MMPCCYLDNVDLMLLLGIYTTWVMHVIHKLEIEALCPQGVTGTQEKVNVSIKQLAVQEVF